MNIDGGAAIDRHFFFTPPTAQQKKKEGFCMDAASSVIGGRETGMTLSVNHYQGRVHANFS